MSLKALSKSCGKARIPGMTTTIQYIGMEDILAYPRTKYEINKDVPGYVAAAGDTKRLTESFVFATGKDWMDIDILVDSGDYTPLMEGEIGGQGFKNKLPFRIDDSNPQLNEFTDCLLANSGCVIFKVLSKSGYQLIMGTLQNPVYIENISSTLVGALGFQYELYCNTGLTAPIYEPDLSVAIMVDANNTVFVDDQGNALGF
jgi:hypothetical protein